LIEFLESCLQGINYKYCRPGQKPGPFGYSESLAVFRSFLTTRDPFKRDFDAALAEDFYRKVRCGVLHEARTYGTWLVHDWHSSGRCVEPATPILYRDNLQKGIEAFASAYAAMVPANADLKSAFVRKFENLCE
jgi:hypothetical protein